MLDKKYHEKKFTKSAFNQAVACPMQAYYYRNSKDYAYHYDGVDGIAEVGDQFGALARVYEGIPEKDIIRADYTLSMVPRQMKTIANTMRYLDKENADVAEAAFATNIFLVYVDILHKRGDNLEIIEVKSKGIGADEPFFTYNKKGEFKSEYLDKILDVTFQKYVVQQYTQFFEKYSHLKVHAKLMLVNTDAKCDVDSLNSLLQIKYPEGKQCEIECAANIREQLKDKTRIDRIVDVDELCDKIINDEIPDIANKFFDGCFVKFVEKVADMYVNNRKDFGNCRFSKDCFKCPFHIEYKEEDGEKKICNEDQNKQDGRAECFKTLHGVDIAGKALISDVKGGIGDKTTGLPKSLMNNVWLKKKKFLLTDIDEYEYVSRENTSLEAFQNSKKFSNADLRYLHVHSAKTGCKEPVFLKAAAKAEMSRWNYPLHFIDFETYQGAVPLFKGTHPNDQIAYQFSHHIGYEDGSWEHAGEFIMLDAGKFPNFEFVRELKKQLEKDEGSVFRYASHENTILNAIRKQLIESSEPDKDELIRFIESITHEGDRNKKTGLHDRDGERDMLDLKEITQKYFYHPSMESSNSIKQVMPAILESGEAFFRKKYKENDMDPYHNLPTLAKFAEDIAKEGEAFPADFDDSDIWNADKQINRGGISKMDYVMLQAGRYNKLHTEAIRKASLKYCELDTLAMVRIWEYFKIMTKE